MERAGIDTDFGPLIQDDLLFMFVTGMPPPRFPIRENHRILKLFAVKIMCDYIANTNESRKGFN